MPPPCSASGWRCSASARLGHSPGAEDSVDRFFEDRLGGIDRKRVADQRLDDLRDRAAAADRHLLDALIKIGIDLQLQPLGQSQGISQTAIPLMGGGGGEKDNTDELIEFVEPTSTDTGLQG